MSDAKTLTRLTYTQAMQRLACKRTKMDSLVQAGIFTVQRDGNGPRSRIYLLSDEIELYLETNINGRGADSVREYRRKKRRLK